MADEIHMSMPELKLEPENGLDQAHRRLDGVVFAAYDWLIDLPETDSSNRPVRIHPS